MSGPLHIDHGKLGNSRLSVLIRDAEKLRDRLLEREDVFAANVVQRLIVSRIMAHSGHRRTSRDFLEATVKCNELSEACRAAIGPVLIYAADHAIDAGRKSTDLHHVHYDLLKTLGADLANFSRFEPG